MNAGPSAVERAWIELDDLVDGIFAAPPAFPEAERAKAQARGAAQILALFTTPFFVTVDEVGVEAAKRREARATGAPHRTPGLDPTRADIDLERTAKLRRCAAGVHEWFADTQGGAATLCLICRIPAGPVR
jgi:hypothetical protein